MLPPQYDTLPFFQLGIYQLKYRCLLYLVISVQERRGRVPARLRCLLTKRPSFQKSGLLEKGVHDIPFLFGALAQPLLHILHDKTRVASLARTVNSPRINDGAALAHPVADHPDPDAEHIGNLPSRLKALFVHWFQ